MAFFNVWLISTIGNCNCGQHNLFFKVSTVSTDNLVTLNAGKYTGTIKSIRDEWHMKCQNDVSFFITTNWWWPLGINIFIQRHLAGGDVCFKHSFKCCLCYIRDKTYYSNVCIQHVRLLNMSYMRDVQQIVFANGHITTAIRFCLTIGLSDAISSTALLMMRWRLM